MTSNQKAAAWMLAATTLDKEIIGYREEVNPPLHRYIRDNVIPSLRRRANIIKRNAKGRR